MSGYKSQVIEDDAASLWTFDGDSFDPTTRKLIVPDGEPRIIIDEIDNLNPAILHSDHETFLGYRLGLPSMVVHEQTDQHSCSFGFYGKIPDHPAQYPKAYLEIPHTITYMFPRLGSFSVEAIFQKEPDTSYQCGVTRQLIKKSGVFNVYFSFPCYSTNTLNVVHPGGSFSMSIDNYLGFSLLSRTIHFVLTWSVIEIGSNVYRGTARVYVNSRIVSEQVYQYFDVFPNTNVNTPIEIAGLGGAANLQNDRQTSALRLDQIAIYDKAITQDQVANHFSKIFPYGEMMKNDFAKNAWAFDDVDSLSNFAISPFVGSLNGEYCGSRSQIIRAQPGPKNIPVSSSCYFQGGGHTIFENVSYYSAYNPVVITGDYTFEWWFNTSESSRGVLFSAQQLKTPYSGPLVQINTRDHNFFSGGVQFTESDTDFVLNSRVLDDNGNKLNFNDGKWHHISLIRRGGQIELWLDAILHASAVTPPKTVGQPGQMVMMNCLPGRLKCDGAVSMFGIYGYALQTHQIKSRVTYSTTYRVRGIVTLMGIPYQATLRFYSTFSGDLIQEIESDPDTGEYMAVFYNNQNVDILVFDKNDKSVRYRSFGPVVPSEFDDLPIAL